jgi:hypothetical protein
VIPDKFYLGKTLREARLPKGAKSSLRAMFGCVRGKGLRSASIRISRRLSKTPTKVKPGKQTRFQDEIDRLKTIAKTEMNVADKTGKIVVKLTSNKCRAFRGALVDGERSALVAVTGFYGCRPL